MSDKKELISMDNTDGLEEIFRCGICEDLMNTPENKEGIFINYPHFGLSGDITACEVKMCCEQCRETDERRKQTSFKASLVQYIIENNSVEELAECVKKMKEKTNADSS